MLFCLEPVLVVRRSELAPIPCQTDFPMPPRPSLKYKDAQRPLSAIYIGNQSNGNNSTNNDGHASSGSVAVNALPDLPEPPSPVSSAGSGLPSPPATNSTGSGSTGDPGSIAVRRSPASMPSAQTSQVHAGSSDSSKAIPTSSRSSSRLSWKPEEHDVDDPLEPDEDQTMRLKISSGSSNESILQRARSLAQRNKLVRTFSFISCLFRLEINPGSLS